MDKKVLIIGSGGREHAIGWKLKQSHQVSHIYFSPGNAGTAQIGTNILLDLNIHRTVIDFAKKNNIDLVVVTPDDPLADGMVDSLSASGIASFGPTKAAAEIEWSKSYAKQLMKEENIPTASFETFNDYDSAISYVKKQTFPLVIKASGLALGKGVVIAHTITEAQEALTDIMVKKIHKEAGNHVVIEEFLTGKEVSFHAFCDGTSAAVFPTAQDHKQIYDNDQGPNTGGMGTIAPVPWVTKELVDEVKETIILPILQSLKKRNRPFKGCLYPGLMITKNGPKVLEFNARFGDPETQSYMRLLKTDIYELFNACIEGNLSKVTIEWEQKSACCIVMASVGYPASSQKGIPITGIENAEKEDDILVFHAGTTLKERILVTNGGRVLGVTATGKTLDEALKKSYKAVKKIKFAGAQYRTDIGRRK